MLPKLQPRGFDCFAIRSVESDRRRQAAQRNGSSVRRIWRAGLLLLVSEGLLLLVSLVALADAVAQAAPPSDTAAEEIAWHAFAQWGASYRWGGTDPATGFDCSGLVRWVAQQAFALQLPRRSEEIAAALPAVPRASPSTGDLVFFNTLGRPFSHVGIYIGDGQFIHAPAGEGRVRIESMQLAYWQRRYNGVRRLALQAAGDGTDRERPTAMPTGAAPSGVDDAYGGP